MTSIANKSAHTAVSASLKSTNKSVIKNHHSSVMCESTAVAELQAETIEVIPELPTFNNCDEDDSGDDFSEYSDENDMVAAAAASRHPLSLNNMDDDDDDDDDGEPFDEYGKNKLIYYCFTLNVILYNVNENVNVNVRVCLYVLEFNRCN